MTSSQSAQKHQSTAPQANSGAQEGRVVSLHLHPAKGGMEMISVDEFEAVEAMGIRENKRYFGRKTRAGTQSKRQVTLIEREQVDAHALSLGLMKIVPGRVRSNIECTGIDLVKLVGWEVEVGEAILYFYEPRVPCEKMDDICQGLRALMENGNQGVLAQVRRSGKIRVGDIVRPVKKGE